jgi:hypothetical protein
MNTLRRQLSFVSLLFTASLAFAGKPTITHITVDETLPPDQRCGFTVQAHFTGFVVDISYTDAQGVFHDSEAFPQGRLTLTNIGTGKSITVNASGPLKITVNPDGSFMFVGGGSEPFDLAPVPSYPNSAPGWFLFDGRFVWFVDANGVSTFAATGTTTNLCTELAP